MYFLEICNLSKIVSARKNCGNRVVFFIFQIFVVMLGGRTFWDSEIDLALADEAIY